MNNYKALVAMAVVGTCACGAQAGVVTTVNISGSPSNSNNNLGKYSGTVEYDSDYGNTGTVGRLTITLHNETDEVGLSPGTITGFGFNVANAATIGAGNVWIVDNGNGYDNFGRGANPLLYGPSTATRADGWGKFEVGVGTDSNLNGGTVGYGIGAGDTAEFVFDIDISEAGFGSLTASSFLTEYSSDPGGAGTTPFIVRFQGFDVGEGSDFVPLTLNGHDPIVPLPSALGFGLAGLAVIGASRRRSRRMTM